MGSGYYQLKARHSGKCLDVYGRSTADGANMIQWTCNSSNTNQQFSFTSTSSIDLEGGLNNSGALSLYPNPVEKVLNISIPAEYQENAEVMIYNNVGKLIFSDNIINKNMYKADVSDIKAGIYIIRISSGNNTITKKFTKK